MHADRSISMPVTSQLVNGRAVPIAANSSAARVLLILRVLSDQSKLAVSHRGAQTAFFVTRVTANALTTR
jgi:hypothetical protein